MSSVIQNSLQAKYHVNYSYIKILRSTFWDQSTISEQWIGLRFSITVPNLAQKCWSTTKLWPKIEIQDGCVVHVVFCLQRILDDWGHFGAAIPHLLNLLNTRESTQNQSTDRHLNGMQAREVKQEVSHTQRMNTRRDSITTPTTSQDRFTVIF